MDRGLTEEEAFPEGHLESEVEIENVLAEVQARLGPDTLSISWLGGADRGHSEELYIGVVGLSSADRSELERELGLADRRTRLVPVAYSKSQLEEFQREVHERLAEAGIIGTLVGTGTREDQRDANSTPVVKVVAPSAELDGVREALEGFEPSDALHLVTSEGEQSLSFSGAPHGPRVRSQQAGRYAFPPYQGGLRFSVAPHSDDCTTGFVHVNAFGYFGSSAGHCSWIAPNPTSASVRVGIVTGVDHVRQHQSPPNGSTYTDSLTFSLSAMPWAWHPRIWVDDTRGHLVVRDRFNGPRPVGARTCMVGIRSDRRCADIFLNAKNATFTGHNNWTLTVHEVDCVNTGVRGGDSGGPAYLTLANNGAKAAGLVTWSNGLTQTCYTLINYTVWFHGELAYG